MICLFIFQKGFCYVSHHSAGYSLLAYKSGAVWIRRSQMKNKWTFCFAGSFVGFQCKCTSDLCSSISQMKQHGHTRTWVVSLVCASELQLSAVVSQYYSSLLFISWDTMLGSLNTRSPFKAGTHVAMVTRVDRHPWIKLRLKQNRIITSVSISLFNPQVTSALSSSGRRLLSTCVRTSWRGWTPPSQITASSGIAPCVWRTAPAWRSNASCPRPSRARCLHSSNHRWVSHLMLLLKSGTAILFKLKLWCCHQLPLECNQINPERNFRVKVATSQKEKSTRQIY